MGHIFNSDTLTPSHCSALGETGSLQISGECSPTPFYRDIKQLAAGDTLLHAYLGA